MYYTVGSTVRLQDKSHDNWIVGNLAMLMIHPGTHRDTRDQFEEFYVNAGFVDEGYNVLVNNVAAASERAGFRSAVEVCPDHVAAATATGPDVGSLAGSAVYDWAEYAVLSGMRKYGIGTAYGAGVSKSNKTAIFLGNSAHSSLFGLFLTTRGDNCIRSRKLVIWKIWIDAVYAEKQSASVVLQV
jgi:hypothetical protein